MRVIRLDDNWEPEQNYVGTTQIQTLPVTVPPGGDGVTNTPQVIPNPPTTPPGSPASPPSVEAIPSNVAQKTGTPPGAFRSNVLDRQRRQRRPT